MRALRNLLQCRLVTVAFIGVLIWFSLHIHLLHRHYEDLRQASSVAQQDGSTILSSSTLQQQRGFVPPPFSLVRQNKQSGVGQPPLGRPTISKKQNNATMTTDNNKSTQAHPLTTGEMKATSSQLDANDSFPNEPPKQRYPDMGKCKVIFRDKAMTTCHMGAFGGNFGDMIGPDIVKRIVETKFGCSATDLPVMDFEKNVSIADDRPCLWTVGSVWRNIRPNDHVWGSGALGNDWEFDGCYNTSRAMTHSNITIYSVRGPNTVANIHRLCNGRVNLPSSTTTGIIEPRGDAGFLIPYIFPEYKYNPEAADKDKCVIAHYVEMKQLQKKLETQKDFPVTQDDCFNVIQPWQTMVGNMTRCKALVSSSLHGIILADAFGIPVVWKKTFYLHAYKFDDYFLSFPGGHWNNSQGNYGLALKLLKNPKNVPKPLPAATRLEYAKSIIKSFPYHLFQTTTN